MRTRQAFAAAATATTLMGALVACAPDEAPVPTQVPSSPSPSPTPSVSAAERQKQADFAAAEKSYRTFRKELSRVLRAGGARKPTVRMRATAGGPYLTNFTGVIQDFATAGARQRGSEKDVVLRATATRSGVVEMTVCEDSRSINYETPRNTYNGDLRRLHVLVRKAPDGIWRVWSGSGEKVSSCR